MRKSLLMAVPASCMKKNHLLIFFEMYGEDEIDFIAEFLFDSYDEDSYDDEDDDEEEDSEDYYSYN